jgi:hypothetical protein
MVNPDPEKRTKSVFMNEVLPIVISTIFLLGWVFLLVGLALWSRGQPTAEDYRQAVGQARSPNAKFVSTSLLGFKFDHPVTVVTWTQARWVSSYQPSDSTTTTTTTKKDIWVTVVPFIKSFCQEHVRSHGSDSDGLALRLKEHLGLPPQTDYDTLVELTVDPRDNARLFRPCGDPSLDATSCKPPTLPAASEVWSNASGSTQSQEWMLRNYYSTYSSQEPYPWTALGYTFDWARKRDSSDFERFGESEFVIPKGDPVHFVSASSTAAYCTPP